MSDLDALLGADLGRAATSFAALPACQSVIGQMPTSIAARVSPPTSQIRICCLPRINEVGSFYIAIHEQAN